MGVAQRYKVRPSTLLGSEIDEYTAYCFDEACAYIASRVDAGDEPQFEVHYSSFSALYSQYQK